jgi:hypothetical protein
MSAKVIGFGIVAVGRTLVLIALLAAWWRWAP